MHLLPAEIFDTAVIVETNNIINEYSYLYSLATGLKQTIKQTNSNMQAKVSYLQTGSSLNLDFEFRSYAERSKSTEEILKTPKGFVGYQTVMKKKVATAD